MNSNMVKPEKFDNLHLVYHFTVRSKAVFHKFTCSILEYIASNEITLTSLDLTIFKENCAENCLTAPD